MKNVKTQTSATALYQNNFNLLPDWAFCKLCQIVGDKKRNIPAVLPVSRSAFLSRVKDGSYHCPKYRLGARSVAYKVADVRALAQKIGASNHE